MIQLAVPTNGNKGGSTLALRHLRGSAVGISDDLEDVGSLLEAARREFGP